MKYYTVKPSLNLNPELISLITPLIDLLELHENERLSKKMGKTDIIRISCISSLSVIRSFIKEGNKTACILTFKNLPLDENMIKKSFYGNSERQQTALKYLKEIILHVGNWISEN